MREFKFFRGIIRDELLDRLSEEIRQEIDSEILRNLTGTYEFPLTGNGTVTVNNGDYTLTTTNTGTVDYNTLLTSTNTGNLHYLNHFINMGGGNRA